MQLADWLRQATADFRAAGIDTAQLDARLLAQAVCGLTAAAALAEPERPLSASELDLLQAYRHRRAAREPVSRILGSRGFMDFELEITPATLDPRPDTEVLVEAAIELLTAEGRTHEPLVIADLGTGSGAILVALLKALPAAHGLGIDISPEALDVAQRNMARHGVGNRARLHRGSWFENISMAFDLIISNPPYIPTQEIAGLEREVTGFDPMTALDGGADGLSAYRAIAAQAPRHMRSGSWLVLEVGHDQADAVANLLDPEERARQGHRLRTFPDLTGCLRCVALRHQDMAAG